MTEEKQKAETGRDRVLAQNHSLGMDKSDNFKSRKTEEQQRISMTVSRATSEKDNTIRLQQSALKTSRDVLNILADILYRAREVFRRAIDAIIHFGTG